MRILFIADVVGRGGRRALAGLLPGLREETRPDFVIANAENAAGGFGLSEKIAHEFLDGGVDVLTSGNHVWDQREFAEKVAAHPRVLRPANYAPGVPGRGHGVFQASGVPVGVLNLQGRVFLGPVDCPFRAADRLVSELASSARILFVDFHAEATAEKEALGWYLDGRVSALIGTHTHVPTADTRLLPGGTAYQTDAGRTGSYASVIGFETEGALRRQMLGIPTRLEPAKGDLRLSGTLVDVDEGTGKATAIDRVERRLPSPSPALAGARESQGDEGRKG